MEFETFVSQAGFDAAALTAQQRTALQASWRASLREGAPTAPDHGHAAARLAAFAANKPDAADLSEAQELADKYLAGVTTRKSFDESMMLLERRGPMVRFTQRRDAHGPAVVEAKILAGLGMPLPSIAKHFDDRTADAASGRTMGLHDLLRASLAAAGRHVPSGKLTPADISGALQFSAGPSTISIPGILSNVANKLLLESFNSTATTWPKFCRVSSNNDFKAATRYRLTGTGTFQEVAPGGEIKHVSLGEADSTAAIATYGAMISLDRRDLVNDDLGALQSVPRALGRMSAIKVEKSVFTLLLANADNFFGTGNGNYASGSPSALSSTSLAVALGKFRDQVDANGDPIYLNPAVLLVPPAIESTALALMNSTEVVATTTANAPIPSGNSFRGLAEVVVAPFLGTAAGLTGASNTGWYLLCAPGDFAIVELATLNGMTMPTIESGEVDFNRLGMSWRAYHDFGVSLLEHRGGVLSTGA